MSHRRRDKPVEELRRTWTSTEDLEETLQGMFARSAMPEELSVPSFTTPVQSIPVQTQATVSTGVDTIYVPSCKIGINQLSTPVDTIPVQTADMVATPVKTVPATTGTEPSGVTPQPGESPIRAG